MIVGDVVRAINASFLHTTKELIHNVKHKGPEYLLPEIICYAVFPQTWTSVALGFATNRLVAGRAMCVAYTVILQIDFLYYVYFNGRFAYKCGKEGENIDQFLEDIASREMASVEVAQKRYGLID